MEKPVSPSQLCLERISSGVLKDLFNTATSSYNTLLQKESDAQESPKHFSYKSPKGVSTARHHDRPLPTLVPLTMSGLAFGCRDSRHAQSVFSCFSTSSSKQTNSITMLGSAIRLSPCPIPRPKNSCPAGTKLPQLSRVLPAARDVENSIKKLCILTAIKPSNVEKEKARFFKADFKYNPQFEYSNPLPTQVLAKHSTASDRFLTQVSAHTLTQNRLRTFTLYPLLSGHKHTLLWDCLVHKASIRCILCGLDNEGPRLKEALNWTAFVMPLKDTASKFVNAILQSDLGAQCLHVHISISV